MLLLNAIASVAKDEVNVMYYDPELTAVLLPTAIEGHTIWKQQRGKNNEYVDYFIGKTAVAINSGEVTSKINWGVNGLDTSLSLDIKELIECFVVHDEVEGLQVGQHYVLRNSRAHILAEARTQKSYSADKVQVYVRGKCREDVVKLFDLIRNGETAPESLGGRRGLIRDLRQQLSDARNICSEQFEQFGELVGQLSDANDENRRLRAAIAELKKPKDHPLIAWFKDFFGHNEPQTA